MGLALPALFPLLSVGRLLQAQPKLLRYKPAYAWVHPLMPVVAA